MQQHVESLGGDTAGMVFRETPHMRQELSLSVIEWRPPREVCDVGQVPWAACHAGSELGYDPSAAAICLIGEPKGVGSTHRGTRVFFSVAHASFFPSPGRLSYG